MHLLGHLLLTSRVDFTSFGSMFKSRTYQLLGITSLGSNSQAHHGSFGYSLTSTGSEFRDPHVFAIMLAYSLGAYTTTFGSMFQDNLVSFGLDLKKFKYGEHPLFLSHQFTSVSLYCYGFHLVVVYVLDSVDHFLLIIPKRKISPDIIISLDRFTCTD